MLPVFLYQLCVILNCLGAFLLHLLLTYTTCAAQQGLLCIHFREIPNIVK